MVARAKGPKRTVIRSNGSKWAGESPDSIDVLLDVLGREVLDRRFGTFISHEKPLRAGSATRFFGNFLNLSHGFQIDSSDPEVVAKLTAAIEANVRWPEFRAQPSPERRKRERAAREADQLRRLQGRTA